MNFIKKLARKCLLGIILLIAKMKKLKRSLEKLLRKALKMLDEMGVNYDKINYYEKPFTKNKLKTLLKKMNLKAEDILRKRAKEYKELDFKNSNYNQAQIIEFMVKYPDLIERPIDRKSTRLNSSHIPLSRMPSSA